MRKIFLILLLFTFVSFASAGTFSSVVVYGDSLSDNGNLYAVSGYPPAPYYHGRMSNGPVAVENMATQLGAPLFDFAWIGATTGIGNHADHGTPTNFGAAGLPGMQAELVGTQSLVPGLAASGALFVVWGGPNDFLEPSPLDGNDPFKIANRAADDIVGIVLGLQALGAQNILVPGMPDLGLTPYFSGMGLSSFGSGITDYFNARLFSELPSGVIYFDTAGLMRNIVANPAAFGFTDVKDPCFDGTTVCSNPDQYLFFDDFHPTAAAHTVLGTAFERTAVPEPATCVLVLSGLLAGLRKKGLPRR
jgi:phospholipase/lecithinase/hemolysin